MFAYQNSWKKYVFTGQHLARIDYCGVFVYNPWKLLEVNEHIVFLLITPLYQYSLLNKPSQWQFSLTDWNGEFSYLILFARSNCMRQSLKSIIFLLARFLFNIALWYLARVTFLKEIVYSCWGYYANFFCFRGQAFYIVVKFLQV